MSSPLIGIDLGTTNSVICRLDGGRAEPIAIGGTPIVPSVVLFDGKKTVVGREARNLELQMPGRVLRSAKRDIGSDVVYKVGRKNIKPEEVSAEVLRYLASSASNVLGTPVRDVVITVPAYFDDAQRQATLRAGELAGLKVLRLLNEPTAASLVYEQVTGASPGGLPEVVLVYDLGGGTFDVSILEIVGDVREVISTTGDSRLGGDDFDALLVDHFLQSLEAEQGFEPRTDPSVMARLRRVAEDTKIALSSELVVHVREEFIGRAGERDVHLSMELHRSAFESMIEPLVRRTLELVERALQDADLHPADLDRVVLVGGSTRIPFVQQILRDALADANDDDGEGPVVDIHGEVDVDLAVGLGAAIQAGLLHGAEVSRILVDVASHSLGLRARGPQDWLGESDTFVPIIPRNTALPARQSHTFYTIFDKQEEVDVWVYQGEHPRATMNTLVGRFDHRLAPRPESSPVHATLEYDLDGIVKVSISQPGASERTTVEMSLPGAGAAREVAPVGTSVLEGKVRRLLGGLEPDVRADLEARLTAFLSARGEAREALEEDLLEFIFELEDDAVGSLGEDD